MIKHIQFLGDAGATFFASKERCQWLSNKATQYSEKESEQTMVIDYDFGHQTEKENPDYAWAIKEGDKFLINGGLIWHGDHYGSHT